MFNARTFRGDLFGGITAGIVALPLALAFGVTSGMGAIAGLYGAIAIGIIAALFGGTSTQISGPAGPMTVVAATIVASFSGDIGLIFTTFFLAGLIEMTLGFTGLGKFIKYIPYPVVSGFMSGIGVIIILLQLFPLLGLKPSAKVLDSIQNIWIAIPDTNMQALFLSLFTISVIYIFPKITKSIPSTLVALVSATAISVLLRFEVPTIGQIPAGLPELHLPSFSLSTLNIILIPAVTLAALGAIDSLLTSVVADKITKTYHDSNKELFGQGLGNMAAALIGGIPGAGATMRTVVNVNSGGRTKFSGIVHGLFLISILLGLGAYAARIPMAVLAGILITVGIGIIDYKGIMHIKKISKSDATVMVTVLAVTVFVDLLQAVIIGLLLSSLLFTKRMSDIVEKNSELKEISEFINVKEEKQVPGMEKISHNIYIQRLDGPLFFGFANTFEKNFNDISESGGVILDLAKVPHIDQSGLYAIEEIINKLKDKNTPFILINLQVEPRRQLENLHYIPELISEEHITDSVKAAVEIISSDLKLETEKLNEHLMLSRNY